MWERSCSLRMTASKCKRNDATRKSPLDNPNVITNSSKKHHSMLELLGKNYWETRHSQSQGYRSMSYLLITKEKCTFTVERSPPWPSGQVWHPEDDLTICATSLDAAGGSQHHLCGGLAKEVWPAYTYEEADGWWEAEQPNAIFACADVLQRNL